MTPSQIVILRHAEKPDDPRDLDLSPAGEARAKMLATLIPKRFPHAAFVFAAARSTSSNRPVETITPTATALGLQLNDSIADQDYAVLAADLLGKPKYDGKLVIVCWHHGHIPDLAMELGVLQAAIIAAPGMIGLHWDPTVFDRFWSLEFTGGGINFTTSSQTADN